MVLGDMGNDYSFLVDNVNINFSPEYSSEDPILQVLYVSQPNSNITYQNSEININVPVTDDGIPLFEFCKKVKFINNTINIHETMESGDDLLLTAFYAGQSNPRMSTDENEFENNIISIELPDDSEAEVCAIQLLSSNNILNNNTITITSNANAKAIELIGNNNTVIDNLLMANTLTGDDAVNATGENNVVENNTAPEMDTRIPTSIELSYDVAPIDVGQRLVIRGVFKADGVEASAEGIKVYDNNELIDTINTRDEFGTITYAYTSTVNGSHIITFEFEGNDTYQATSTNVTVEVNEVIVPAITPDWEDEAAQRGFPSQTTGALGGWKFSNFKDGVFGEVFHVNLADANLAKLPENVKPETAVMLSDMFSTGMMGSENAKIKLGSTVAVIGIGPVGLCSVAGARNLGAGRIFAVGTRPNCVKVAKEYGATDIVNYKEGPIDEQIMEATDNEGVDAVIIAGGNMETWKQAVKMAKAGSVISNVNYLSGADIVPLPREAWGCGMANIDIATGLCPGGRVRMERLASLIEYGRINPDSLITDKFKGFDKVEDALMLMKDKPKDLIKPVVICDE